MALSTYTELQAAIADRFWSKVEKSDGCWLWRGTLSNNGYGTFRLGSLKDGTRRNVSPHRLVCEMLKGAPLTEGEQALHTCDNKICVNPDHLYVGTHHDNMRDARDRGRTGGRPMLGSSNPNAKLSASDVMQIRQSCARNVDLSRIYGISKTHVGHIKSGKSWGCLHGA